MVSPTREVRLEVSPASAYVDEEVRICLSGLPPGQGGRLFAFLGGPIGNLPPGQRAGSAADNASPPMGADAALTTASTAGDDR